jgi:hypothetical protein
MASRASRTTTFREVPTRSKSGPAPRMKYWFPAIARPGRHPGLPHSPSIKPPWSREVWFNKVATTLLGLSSPIKAQHAVSTILNLLTGAKMTRSLIDTCGATTLETQITMTPSPPFPSDDTALSPNCLAHSHNQTST